MSWLELGSQAWPDGAAADVDLDHEGRPRSPVVILTDGSSTTEIHGHGGPVLIVVEETSAGVSPAVAAAADVVLVRRDPDGRAVAVADPLASARALAERVSAHPVAALTLAWLMRSEHFTEVRRGLVAESAAYSMLLAGEEFRHWREQHPPRPRAADASARLRLTREGQVLRVTLTNASRRNAMDARLRDELVEALAPAAWDDALSVVIDAEGPSFGSGGDLDEFATAPDPARAHLTRLTASAGAILAELGDRAEVRVHGDCFGAAIELAAFAGHVVARPGSTLTLPELAMGLLPGAGGTTSIPRRIGRHRATWWALSGESIDAGTALAWGLVDALG